MCISNTDHSQFSPAICSDDVEKSHNMYKPQIFLAEVFWKAKK